MAERQPSKLHVAGSNPVSRSTSIADAALRLRRAIDRAGPTTADPEIARALSRAYRSGGVAPALDGQDVVAAYAASRMPATFAAAARAMAAAAERAPAFAPGSQLDLGAGTGAAIWAARAVWPSLRAARAIDRSTTATDLGTRIARASGDDVLARVAWVGAGVGDVREPADLVSAAYVLGELDPASLDGAVDRLWAATRGVLILVEPGSRAGFRRVVSARDRLIATGARVVAPCPGPEPCPVLAARSSWCHFLARLDRSPRHRRAKAASRSWEDEPYSYVVVARPEVLAEPRPRVVLGRPRQHPGRVELRICDDGRIETRVVSRRDGAAWRVARDLEWGDAVAD